MCKEKTTLGIEDPVALRSMHLPYRHRAVLAALSSVVLMTGAIVFVARNVLRVSVWSDEAATIMTSFGWPPLGGPIGTLEESVAAALMGNADVGGFTIFLRLWVEILGGTLPSVRFFALFWIVLYLLSVAFLILRVSRSWLLVIGGVSLMLLENITPFYALEIRPYGAALASSVGVLVVAVWFRDAPSPWRASLVLASCLFLSSHQYVSLVPLIATAGVLALSAFDPKLLKAKKWWTVGTGLLLMAYLPTIFLLTRGPVVGTGPPGHVQDLLIQSQSVGEVVDTLQTNLLSATAAPRTLFLLLVPVLLAVRWIPRTLDWEGNSRSLILYLWVYVALGTVISFALSALGAIPWVLGTRWSITEVGLIAVSVAGLLGVLSQLAPSRRWLSTSLVVFTVCSSVVASYRIASFQHPRSLEYVSDLAPILLTQPPGTVVVDSWIFYDMRYLIEFGGRYSNIRSDWVTAGPRPTTGSDPADVEDLESFLQGADVALVWRSGRAFEEIPESVKRGLDIVELPSTGASGVTGDESPIVLFKK